MLSIVSKQLAVSLIMCLIILPVMAAQDLDTNWMILRSIPAGQLTLVKTTSGRSLKGLFQRATDSALELSVNGKAVDLRSAEVSRVYVLRGRQILKGILIGAAAGAAAGAGIGALTGRQSNRGWSIFSEGDCAAMGAGVGIIGGSLAGLAIGSSKHKKELVYEASRAR